MTNGYFSSKKEMWQAAHMLQCFEGFLLTGLPNINSPSVPITSTYSDFNAAEVASSQNSPLIFPAFCRHGRCTAAVCAHLLHTLGGLWPLLLPPSPFLSHMRNVDGIGLKGSGEA